MPIVVNGWTLYTHPLFVEQVRSLSEKVEALKAKDPQGYKTKNVTKRLAAIYRLTFETISSKVYGCTSPRAAHCHHNLTTFPIFKF